VPGLDGRGARLPPARMISGKVYAGVRRQLERARRIEGMADARLAPGDLADAELLSTAALEEQAMIRFHEGIAGDDRARARTFRRPGRVPLQDVDAGFLELEYVLKKTEFLGRKIASQSSARP